MSGSSPPPTTVEDQEILVLQQQVAVLQTQIAAIQAALLTGPPAFGDWIIPTS